MYFTHRLKLHILGTFYCKPQGKHGLNFRFGIGRNTHNHNSDMADILYIYLKGSARLKVISLAPGSYILRKHWFETICKVNTRLLTASLLLEKTLRLPVNEFQLKVIDTYNLSLHQYYKEEKIIF